ncbi:hypothetical protein WUBG_01398 [Wuchereria bancrofti]|uniref:Uncharacterized protein n=1 Tax=Wuchereria bancrofti TaxID=6293 RepID=J9EZK8_WUCBA|nr:hypothetical protein WUBG_01398 [Wuchereria bancrofti]
MKIQQGITDNDYVYRLTRAEEQQLLHSVDQTVQINHDILVDIVDIIFRLSLLRKSLNHKLIVGGEHEQIDRHLRENGKNISGENSPHIVNLKFQNIQSGTLEKYRQENSATGYFGLTELRQNGGGGESGGGIGADCVFRATPTTSLDLASIWTSGHSAALALPHSSHPIIHCYVPSLSSLWTFHHPFFLPLQESSCIICTISRFIWISSP